MLNLQALEKAFEKVSEIGRGELTFDLEGTAITLRTLIPAEEVAIQKYAFVAFEAEQTALAANQDYMERFQTSVLSYAICQIGVLDLRKEMHVATGELLPNGQEVKIPKTDALRKIVAQWSAPVRALAFRKFGDLLDQVHNNTSKMIEMDPVDLDAEIGRTEDRLKELQARKKQREDEVKTQHPFLDSVQQQVQLMTPKKAPEARTEAEPDAASESNPAPQAEAPVVQPVAQQAAQSASVIPNQAPPPVRKPQMESSVAREQVAQNQQRQEEISDEYLAEIAAEEERLARARQARQAMPVRQPPHMAAQQAAQQAADPTDQDNAQPPTMTPVGQIGGVDAYRLGDAQTYSNKQAPRDNRAIQVDPVHSDKSVNPRFRRPNQ